MIIYQQFKADQWTIDTCYCTISCSALMPYIETVCVKIILWDLIRRDEIQNYDTSKLQKKFLKVLLYYIYKKKRKKEKEQKRQAKLILNNQNIMKF